MCLIFVCEKQAHALHETRKTDGERQTAAAADFSRQSRGETRPGGGEDSRERWEYRNPGGRDGRTDGLIQRTEARRFSLDTASYTLFRSEATRRWLRASESEVMRSVCQVV